MTVKTSLVSYAWISCPARSFCALNHRIVHVCHAQCFQTRARWPPASGIPAVQRIELVKDRLELLAIQAVASVQIYILVQFRFLKVQDLLPAPEVKPLIET